MSNNYTPPKPPAPPKLGEDARKSIYNTPVHKSSWDRGGARDVSDDKKSK